GKTIQVGEYHLTTNCLDELGLESLGTFTAGLIFDTPTHYTVIPNGTPGPTPTPEVTPTPVVTPTPEVTPTPVATPTPAPGPGGVVDAIIARVVTALQQFLQLLLQFIHGGLFNFGPR
ncbi:MAG: hypothetical protein ACRDTD_10680, partial [Pseudonocardiaceae bacterium]